MNSQIQKEVQVDMEALVDKTELFDRVVNMLTALELECLREEFSLQFNDAWLELETAAEELEAELNDD